MSQDQCRAGRVERRGLGVVNDTLARANELNDHLLLRAPSDTNQCYANSLVTD